MLLCTLLVGETNQVSTNLQNLENNRFESALLYGKRLVLITDSERYGGAISTLKGITGGDPIRYERKNRQQQAPFIFTGLVMIAANEQVQNTDYTSGLVRRRISINFSQRVTQKEREDWDKKGGLLNAMKKELPGLLNELLALGDDEVTRTIGNPGAATWTANRQAMVHQNQMAAWLEDEVVADPDATPYVGAKRQNKDPISGLITLKDVGTKLYPNYLQWVCENGQHHPIALRRFTELLLDICRTLGIEVEKLRRTSAGTPIKGIRLRTDQDKDIPTPVLGIVIVDDGVSKCRVGVDKTAHETRASAQSVGSVGKNRSQDFEKNARANQIAPPEDDDIEVLA
jgi:putative DNA primase/helicase